MRDSAFYAGRRFADRAQALAHTETVRARLERDGWTLVHAVCRCAEGWICERHRDRIAP